MDHQVRKAKLNSLKQSPCTFYLKQGVKETNIQVRIKVVTGPKVQEDQMDSNRNVVESAVTILFTKYSLSSHRYLSTVPQSRNNRHNVGRRRSKYLLERRKKIIRMTTLTLMIFAILKRDRLVCST